MIPYGKHDIQKQDIEAVVEVLEHQFLTPGTQVPAFEKALCDYTGAAFAVAANSCTSGLHLACLAADIGAGDLVWTVPNSFAASANCARYCGADVDFVDINSSTFNIDVELLSNKLDFAASQGRLPKALIVVHFAGAVADMKSIHALCKAHNIIIVEDAAHALGAKYHDKPVGACAYSDMAVFSFHPVKSITSAEGGAVMTNDPVLAKRLSMLVKHGITRDTDQLLSSDEGDWYYEQQLLGFNYRLSDVHAALGLSQLTRLDDFTARRREIAAWYFSHLRELPLQLPDHTQLASSSWHLFMVQVDKRIRRHVFDQLRARGIGVNVHYIPVHWHPYYQRLGFYKGQFPVAEHYYEGAISLPIFVQLSEAELRYIVDTLSDVLATQ